MGDDHVRQNREAWNRWAEEFVEPAEQAWASDRPSWGIWGVPDADVGLFPEVEGLDVVELGCGTAYVSAWAARRGGRPVALDNSPKQLETARRMQEEHGLRFPLILADAERVPLADAAFDVAISEYGAALWCDPEAWIAEAARLLRPGGRLVFLTNSYLAAVCSPPDEEDAPVQERLMRDHFGMRRFDWPAEGSVEFHIPHGEMIRLLRRCGFEVEDLIEIQAPEDASSRWSQWVPHEWARRWPSEEAWTAVKR